MDEDDQERLWEWCRCLGSMEAAAGAILQHLGKLKTFSKDT